MLLKNKMKKLFLCVILARAGSKTIKDKNIVKINKHPLIAYSIRSAIKSKLFDDVVVSTDGKRIREASLKYGASVPFLRSKKLSTGKARAVDALHHALLFCEKKFNKKYNYIMEIMCTNPLKKSIDIKNIAKIQIMTNADSVIAVTRVLDHHPSRIKKIIKGKIAEFGIREVAEKHRQQLKPNAYVRCGSIYSMRRDMLMKKIRYGSKNSIPYIMPEQRVVNIDEKIDLEFAKFIMKKNKIFPE